MYDHSSLFGLQASKTKSLKGMDPTMIISLHDCVVKLLFKYIAELVSDATWAKK